MCFSGVKACPLCVFPSVVCCIPNMGIVNRIPERVRFSFNLSSTDFCVNCINTATFICKRHSANLFYKLRILAHQSCLNTIHKEVSRSVFSQSFCFRSTIHHSSIDNYVVIYVFYWGLSFYTFYIYAVLVIRKNNFSVIILLALALFALTVLVGPPPFAIVLLIYLFNNLSSSFRIAFCTCDFVLVVAMP